MKFLQNIKDGFTLAEVLITLVIVGVIAAMTIPTLMNKTNHSELKAGFNKALSVSSQVIQKMKHELGDIIYDPENDTAVGFRNKFMKYLVVTCDNNCVNPNKYKNHANLSDSKMQNVLNSNTCFITQDGMVFWIMQGNPSNQLFVTIDVNGHHKGPNKWGYDTFTFYIPWDSQILKPCTETEPYGSSCDKTASSLNGLKCSGKAIAEKDYFENL